MNFNQKFFIFKNRILNLIKLFLNIFLELKVFIIINKNAFISYVQTYSD